MTDRIDYTQRPEVLKYLGWQWVNCSDPQDDGYWEDAKGDLRIDGLEEHPPTQAELWEGLCKACDRPGWKTPTLLGIDGVDDVGTYYLCKAFTVREYGTLNNCIAATLYWVLQQAEKKEG